MNRNRGDLDPATGILQYPRTETVLTGNYKSQISNTKQITMTEIQNPKNAQDIEKRTYQSLVIE